MKTYQETLNEKRDEVIIVISPSKEDYVNINKDYQKEIESISDNLLDDREVYDQIRKRYLKEIRLREISLREAQEFAEPLRISFPDQCVSLYSGKNTCIGNTSWNDQVKMFFQYPTYTELGKRIIDKRKEEAKEQGILASYE